MRRVLALGLLALGLAACDLPEDTTVWCVVDDIGSLAEVHTWEEVLEVPGPCAGSEYDADLLWQLER